MKAFVLALIPSLVLAQAPTAPVTPRDPTSQGDTAVVAFPARKDFDLAYQDQSVLLFVSKDAGDGKARVVTYDATLPAPAYLFVSVDCKANVMTVDSAFALDTDKKTTVALPTLVGHKTQLNDKTVFWLVRQAACASTL